MQLSLKPPDIVQLLQANENFSDTTFVWIIEFLSCYTQKNNGSILLLQKERLVSFFSSFQAMMISSRQYFLVIIMALKYTRRESEGKANYRAFFFHKNIIKLSPRKVDSLETLRNKQMEFLFRHYRLKC